MTGSESQVRWDEQMGLRISRVERKGRLTVDRVRASHLLADHKRDRDDRALAIPRNGPHLTLLGPEAAPAHLGALLVQLDLHLLQLGLDVGVRDGQLAHVAQRGAGLLPVVLLGEPARGLVAEEHADEEEDGWQELHRKGHDERRVPVQVQERAVVYPEGYHGAHGFEKLV